MANFEERFERLSKDVFDDDFYPGAFHEEEGKLLGVELHIKWNDKEYSFYVGTLALQMDRMAMDIDGNKSPESKTDDDDTMVIAADEIMPSDLLHLRKMTIDELRPYLTEQE